MTTFENNQMYEAAEYLYDMANDAICVNYRNCGDCPFSVMKAGEYGYPVCSIVKTYVVLKEIKNIDN